ncbi:Putative FAD dependent oxidoreductase, FAD/NAD(P)-binding domain superfamily, MTOX family [Septoria linicola]|uniref:FAD dependent oxidoreductase, FAD/NAD(P)-binding domain superfamily, MTOX family n=1 Tax=Septoria linicola TaxID=215465 RepID=A0A9Q9ATJ7_9PEZI|nr:putative FAD dependent oxidoreductase, FAD/NAD(P)-binding domain superfamily, MTOX family [Septoria linicola]USW55159.1 Putative FAD dependent oxidoreductase, FAD/NAD(P)-binding domain superfamily, MTOX family [Septoria linicola]
MPVFAKYGLDGRRVMQPNNIAPNPKRIDIDHPHEGKPEPTVLIIGAGTFGTSTAYHLAQFYKDPSRITVIDSSSSAPKPAASIDVNRVIRTDYANKLYCDLACETIHPWFWSEELGPYFHKVGWLMYEEDGSNLKSRIKETFEGRGSTQAQDIDLDKISSRWSAMDGTSNTGFQSAYFNPEAGWCDAAQATHAFMLAAEKRGVRRETGKIVDLIWNRTKSRIEGARTLDGRTFEADEIVLAAGPWTSQILSPTEDELGLSPDARIECQVQATGLVAAYYRVSEAEVSQLDNFQMPVVVYGGLGEIIPPSSGNQLMKYANSRSGIINTKKLSSGARISVPADQYEVPECLKQETKAMISEKVLPQFARGKEPDYWRICWDAQSPTEDFLICRHPDQRLKGLVLATGGSFHSYKFLPVIGKYIANVLYDTSNGEEKDKAWGWKSAQDKWVDVHERGLLSHKSVVKTELKDLFARDGRSQVTGPRL